MANREPAGEDAAHGPDRLPRGRHGLPRELVAENQRERLLEAIVEVVAEHGYNAATVAQVTEASKLSRRTFYENFSNKEDGFIAAHEAIEAHLTKTMQSAAGAERQWPAQVQAGLRSLLEQFAEHPDLARFFMISSVAAGDKIAECHHEAMAELVGVLIAGAPRATDSIEPSTAQERALAGGLSGLIARKIKAGEGSGLPGLLPSLTELILRPYLGAKEAIRGSEAADSDAQ